MPRAIKTPDELREFILTEVAKHTNCKDSYFGGIYWHEPDRTECNWQISAAEGNDWSKCIEHIMPFIKTLRYDYIIPEPQ